MYKNMVLVYSLIGPLRYFADQMKEAAKKRGIDCYQADCKDEKTYTSPEFYSFLQRPGVFMLTFNGALVNLNDEQGENIWKKYGVPVYASIQDHPRNYDSFLKEPTCDLHVLSLDKNHIEFIKRFFPKIKDIKFWPNGGTAENGNKPYEDRTIDVIYMGNCQEKIKVFPTISVFPGNGADMFMFGIRYLLEHPEATAEEAVYLYLDSAGIRIDEVNLYKLMVDLNVSAYIESYARRYFKLTCMKALDDAGIHVDVYGGGWLDETIVFSDNIRIHDRIPNKELNMILGDAKISLCFMPWYKRGSSEKALDSMLNGAVCVTDRSEYLELNYHDGENIIFFDLNNPAQLAADIRWLLDNPGAAAGIAKRGYETALLHDTWNRRFDQHLLSDNY